MIAVVVFLGDSEVETVPESRLCGKDLQCYWPNWVSISKIEGLFKQKKGA